MNERILTRSRARLLDKEQSAIKAKYLLSWLAL